MNRYKSSQKWRKVFAGHYESPDGKYTAIRRHGQWHLEGHGMFLTLADCQEHAEKLERSQRAAWWGFREGTKKANDASV